MTLVGLSGLLSGCHDGAPSAKAAPPTDIVLCPNGSTFHAAENRCVAEAHEPVTPPKTSTPPTPLPLASAPVPPASPSSNAKLSVTCGFSHGWVAVVPAAVYPKDDEYIMQALIGFSDDPTFWQGQSEYAALEPYKAVACDGNGVSLEAPEGDVFVLVGEADTFAKRNRYSRNGMLRKLTLKKAEPVRIDVSSKDLVRTFPCISCPWVHFEGIRGSATEPFVMLARRASREERGTDRRTLRVPVVDGTIRIIVSEHENEITHLDALTVEYEGMRLRPLLSKPLSTSTSTSRFALDADDGLEVVLAKGTRIEQSYLLPPDAYASTRGDGWVTVTVSATGHYVPVP